MRVSLGLVGLVAVLAILSTLMKKQSEEVWGAETLGREGAPAMNTPAQGRAAQQQLQQDLNKALEQGAKREGLYP